MDIYDLIETRRTIHAYKPDPVDPSLLQKIVSTGHYAPNHMLTWPWRLTLVGPETRQDIAEVAVAIKGASRDLSDDMKAAIRSKITNPGGMLVISQVRTEDAFRSKEDYASIACAIQNIQLAAHAEGLGAKWSTGGVTRDPRTYKVLGIDETTEAIEGFVWIGVPNTVPTIKRPKIESVLRSLP